MNYCTYLTIYRGNSLPPFYIGYTSTKNIDAGYRGTVSSAEYETTWKHELNINPGLFDTKIIKIFATKEEALKHERYLHEHFNVIDNPLYINKSISHIRFANFGGRKRPDLAEQNRTRKGIRMSEKQRKKISETIRKRKIGVGRKRPDVAERNRLVPKTETQKAVLKKYNERKMQEGFTPEEIEAKRKAGKARKGRPMSEEGKASYAKAAKLRASKKITCEYCGHTSSVSPNFYRYHGKKCKLN